MAKKKLHLLQLAASGAAEAGTTSPEIMRCEFADADLTSELLDDARQTNFSVTASPQTLPALLTRRKRLPILISADVVHSSASIAYASAYLKCHYLAAFTCELLNNQPMGFYSPAVLVKDAQRHGLRVLPAHVNASEWNCTVENRCLRLGLRYVRGVLVFPARCSRLKTTSKMLPFILTAACAA